MNLVDLNRVQALAEDDQLPKWKGLLIVLFVEDVDVLESLASNPGNSVVTDWWLAKHAEPSIRANVARKAGLGVLHSRLVDMLLHDDPDPHVRDAAEVSMTGDWNRDFPFDPDDFDGFDQ